MNPTPVWNPVTWDRFQLPPDWWRDAMRSFRFLRGWRQRDLATWSGYSPRTIEAIERGAREPPAPLCRMLALAAWGEKPPPEEGGQ